MRGTGSGLHETLSQRALPDAVRGENNGAQHDRDHLLGAALMRMVLAAPTVANWLTLAWAHWFGTVELVDSLNHKHTLARSHNLNFEQVFFASSVACIQTLFAHIWLTLGTIAREHQLGHTGCDALYLAAGGGRVHQSVPRVCTSL